MLQTTRAVVLRTFKHGDNFVILKAYTECFGVRSYIVRISKRGSAKPAHLQPLDRLEIVVSESGERELHTVREVRTEKAYVGIAGDPARGLLLLFAQEVFYRTLKEESPDPELFDLVQRTLEEIDTGDNLGQLPLLLLLRLARHLGFLPELPGPGEDRFDLREGHFFNGVPEHGFCMNVNSSLAFAELLRAESTEVDMHLPSDVRIGLLEQLLDYFRLHVEGFGQLRSPAILHALLH
ncbi:MAG: DNA repair protein RecO [Flavobacteriales bacterium]|jgi:DNA repair protein RecO (recombination protein O)|nr:DNA repair protein RecO [Flavobacteriales bacterium]MBK6894885.1 DNA repair protein RecO [Flavobacteriales bacterium]MBK7285925.1 DNA repair protein RecO [Flavobacteriales bacterium]MBK9058389.1 DNA repair protein RecO [Flavobacteriales bacterium]MBK9599609.1 DNA repair protein RecO [Flavobacteriales bacterium]